MGCSRVLSGKIQPVTHELIGAAKGLADQRHSQVWVVVMGAGAAQQADSLFAFGADKVIVVDDSRLTGFHAEIETKAMRRFIEKYKPEIVLFAATTRGRALRQKSAVMENCGLTADCTELE